MKILYHHRIASKDGQYVHVEELTKALKDLGHELIIVGPSVMDKSDFGSEGGLVPILKRHIPGFLYELLELSYSVFAFVKLAIAVREHKPDFLYERYNLFMPAGVWIKKIFKLPMLLEVNAPLFDERKKYNGIVMPALARWSESYAWNGADFVLPVTEVLAKVVEKKGVPRNRINVIPNGIDPEKFNNAPTTEEAKKRLGLDGKLVLGFTGFMREWHGLERIVDLLAADDKRHLLLVGDGPARESISLRAKELGVLEKITITGIVQRGDIASYVAAFDIALQPDVVDYASPLKLFEYMVLGRAIVAPDKDNIREILTNENDALLFDAENEESFLRAVEKLCSDDDLRNKVASGARKTINEKRLTWQRNAERVIGFYKQLVSRSAPNSITKD